MVDHLCTCTYPCFRPLRNTLLPRKRNLVLIKKLNLKMRQSPWIFLVEASLSRMDGTFIHWHIQEWDIFVHISNWLRWLSSVVKSCQIKRTKFSFCFRLTRFLIAWVWAILAHNINGQSFEKQLILNSSTELRRVEVATVVGEEDHGFQYLPGAFWLIPLQNTYR